MAKLVGDAGVEDVKADVSAKTTKVFGKVDPAQVIKKLDEIHRKGELVSGPQPEENVGGGDKKPKPLDIPEFLKRPREREDSHCQLMVLTLLIMAYIITMLVAKIKI